MVDRKEVIIIGAGPGGLKVAEGLAQNGKKVLIFEKNLEIGHKVCAGGLTPKTFRLKDIPITLAETISHNVEVHAFRKTIRVSRKKEFLIATVNREKLGQWMLKKALESGAEIEFNAEVVRVKKNSVVLKDGREIEFSYLVGADGGLSIVRKSLGLSSEKSLMAMQYSVPSFSQNPEIFLDKDMFNSGYAWIFPHKESTEVGCFDELKNARGLSKRFHRWLKNQKINVSNAKLQASLINHDYQGFDFENIFLIGEAAGLTSGWSGEGIHQAIDSGQEVAKKILDPNYKCIQIQQLLKTKKIQERIGKPLQFVVTRNNLLTKILFENLFCL
ncbi:NAD(P)/FAD-dependent oxidoreductase [Patescibacteria group bacterium]|nr:NAD(P)/FAD-dependent oxidoreductase [Patescibacteria group bacterium]